MKSYTLSSKGRLLVLEQPVVMGILNATPDSFFEGSRVKSMQEVLDKAGNMLETGAAILDLGGQSTRPGATRITAGEEADRVLPVLEQIKKTFPKSWISIDTFYASVASLALEKGADIINDISAGDDDEEMLEVLAKQGVPYIAMHKKGTPDTMQLQPEYENVTMEIVAYFRRKKSDLESRGIYDWILDPGFGFGKTLEHNYEILKHLGTLELFQRPVMVGISRKGMVQKALQVSAKEALNGTTALHMAALERGAALLRAHDVKEAMQCIALHELLAD